MVLNNGLNFDIKKSKKYLFENYLLKKMLINFFKKEDISQ